MKTRIKYLISGLVIFACLLGACSGGQTGATLEAPVAIEEAPETTERAGEVTEGVPEATGVTPEATTGAETTESAGATGEATEPAQPETGEQIGGTVTVMGVWADEEADDFLAMVEPFEEQTGVDVEFERSRDLSGDLAERIQDGNPPDIAGLPGPGSLRQYVEQSALVPLDEVLDTARLQEEYPEGFTELSKVDDQIYGLFTKASVKSLVWYRPDVFQERGYQVPETWEELQSLEQQIISEGATPWCIGVLSGQASGWPGTDWIEDLMLRTAGPETYDAWWEHTIPWTDPAVATAWESWGRIVDDPAMVYGGPTSILTTQPGDSSFPLFDEEPGCFLHRQASFITTFIIDEFPDVQLGEDLNFFPFPPIDEQYGNPLVVAGDLFGMFKDTPQARALMKYLASAEAQTIWAERGGFLAPNQAVSTDVYPDDITRQVAQMYVEAESVRFDASDLMPQAVQDAFHSGILQFVQDPGSLQSVLEDIELTAQEADQQ